MRIFLAIVARDTRLAFRSGGGAMNAVIFFALTIVIFALAAGPDRTRLAEIAVPVLWTGAALSAMLSFDRIFQQDKEDGALDAIAETTDMMSVVALAKAAAHWLSTLLPLIIAAPVLGILLNMPGEAYWPVIVSLLVGAPAISMLGTLASALALPLRRASVLMTILTAPLVSPSLIFGVGAAKAGAAGDPLFAPSLMILAAFTLVSCVVAPLAAAALIRFNTD